MQKAGENNGIRIRQALDLIYSSYDDFEIAFMKTNGKEKSIKKRVRLGVPPSSKKMAKIQGVDFKQESGKEWNHRIKKSHNLLLYDIEKRHAFELKICLLVSFNGLKIIWHVEKKK
jgi:hypothetical protein